MEGTVKWYNQIKAYGFIQIEEGKDVFVHRDSIPNGTVLREGDKVEFDIEDSPKGPQAVKVKKL